MITKDRRAPRDKRHHRLRRWVRGSAARPRLAVFRSLNHIYAQVVDDDTRTHAGRGRQPEQGVPAGQPSGGNVAAAKAVGDAAGPAGQGGGLERWCSTAAASSTTGGSRRWRRARAGGRSNGR